MPRINRLYISEHIHAGAVVPLTSEQTHYLRNVLRLAENTPLLLINENDGEWVGEIVGLSKKSGEARVISLNRLPYNVSDMILCLTPLKKDSFDFAVEKAVELGTRTIQPVLTEFTDHNRINKERMNTAVIESMQQCGSPCRTICRDIIPLPMLLQTMDKGRILFAAFESGEARDFSEILTNMKSENSLPAKAAILIGPEGGFSEAEQSMLRNAEGVIPISLGPAILRAETAVVTALTLWQALAGHWKEHKR